MAILNPIVWGWNRIRVASTTVGSARSDAYWPGAAARSGVPIARIGMADLRAALLRGMEDFGACRTDVVVLCAVYPLLGLLLGRVISGYGLLPLLFPLASGFALLGPLAALGLYEMSRRRAQGLPVRWTDAFGVLRSPSVGPVALLGAALVGLFLLWLVAAQGIYDITLGPQAPVSLSAFVHDVFATRAGWAMAALGMGTGFLFAVLVLLISVVSFPLLLDEDVGVEAAVHASIVAVVANPGPMAAWGLIVATGLLAGSVPLLLGLPVTVPVLGHATWHLYRRLVPRMEG